MWTARRIVMLAATFAAFITVYLGYAFTSLGRIDGLPPLPEMYWPGGEDPDTGGVTVGEPRSALATMIQQAFGKNCPELHRPIGLALPSKNMVIAAEEAIPITGRICLKTLSVAMFKDMNKDRLQPEITTLRADVAWIQFDRPVNNFSEIVSRKIVEVELNGRINVINNRKRKERDQDLHLCIPTGPLYYREDTHKIWTHALVELTDHRSKPVPNTITGKGMEMELLAETPAARPGVRKAQRESITGVKYVQLQSSVKIRVFVDGKSGFLGGDNSKKPAAPVAKAPEQAELLISTPGKFRYDLNKDHDLARFDALEVAGSQSATEPPQVSVIRHNPGEKKNDQLICQHLTLRIKRKDGGDAKKPAGPESKASGEGADIETAHAISSGKGRYVVLTSDSEGLIAECHDFFYDAVKQLTILKATSGPVNVTYRDDTKINAGELEIQLVKPAPPPGLKPGAPVPPAFRPYQTVKAKGPGWVVLVDKSEKEKRPVRAEWNDLLTSHREGVQDVLTLTGSARFIDEQAQQSLKADTLKVWLDPPDQAQSQPASGVAGSRKPRHLEAIGHVVARSKDMNIHDTGRMFVRFVDVPAQKHLPPGVTLESMPKTDKRPEAQPIPGKPAEPVAAPSQKALPAGPEKVAQPVSRPGGIGPLLGTPDAQSQQRPFDLSARVVEARVERSPIKSSLDELWCKGQVKVKQDPAKAEEKGTTINGDQLKMTAGDGGYHLVVLGDLAELTADRIYICGPEVNIDQTANKVWVVGDGAMQMESATNFQGEKLTRAVPLTVHWEKSMLFDGTRADFTGNIQATQQDARLASQHLLVTFDRMISLKQGNRGDQPARVKKLVCDQDVRIEDVTRDPTDSKRIIKYQALRAPVLHMDALEPDDDRPENKAKQGNRVVAPGPGSFRVWEPGSAATEMPSATVAKKPAASAEMKMTYVAFRGQMQANSQAGTANFWDDVRVLHMPWARHDQPFDLEKILSVDLPAGALYLRCDRLKVLDYPTDGKPNKQMEGYGDVRIQGRDFHGYASSVTFNQQKQQVILKGSEDRPTQLTRQLSPGAAPETVSGTKITYNRGTGQIEVIGANQIQGQTTTGGKR